MFKVDSSTNRYGLKESIRMNDREPISEEKQHFMLTMAVASLELLVRADGRPMSVADMVGNFPGSQPEYFEVILDRFAQMGLIDVHESANQTTYSIIKKGKTYESLNARRGLKASMRDLMLVDDIIRCGHHLCSAEVIAEQLSQTQITMHDGNSAIETVNGCIAELIQAGLIQQYEFPEFGKPVYGKPGMFGQETNLSKYILWMRPDR